MNKPQKIQAEKLIGHKDAPYKNKTSQKDAILYALGIGFSRDPLREQDFKYTNEFHEQFSIFPTMATVCPKGDLLAPLVVNPHVPQFNPFAILHAEHKIILIKPKIEPDVEYEHQIQILDCADKGKNAFVLFRCNSYLTNEKGQKQLAYINQSLAFIRGLGGFNYPGKGYIKPNPSTPKRKPDYKLIGQTFPNQAFIYRLSFDMNPLHIVPSIAQSQNFQRPLIHGLATYGTVARVVVQEIFENNPEKLKSFQARFVGHVYPGQSLDISVWKEGDTYIYEAEVRQRKTKVIIGVFQSRPAAKL